MNNLDKQYQDLLQDILDNGVTKKDMNKKQIRYFSNGYQWFTEYMYPLDNFQTQTMFKETEEGQMLWPYYDKHEYRTDIRYKIKNYE